MAENLEVGECRFHLRQSDASPAGTVRRSVFVDLVDQVRRELVAAATDEAVEPLVAREEVRYFHSARPGDEVVVDLRVVELSEDAGHWTFLHHLRRAEDQKLLATVIAEGAWRRQDADAAEPQTPPRALAETLTSLPVSRPPG